MGDEGWLDARKVLLKPVGQARLVARVVAEFCRSADREIGEVHVGRVLDRHVYRVPLEEPAEEAGLAVHREKLGRRSLLAGLLQERAPELWERLARHRDEGLTVSHDVYLKLFQLDSTLVCSTLREYEYLMLDEAQDLNPVMRSIATLSGCPVLAVGDPWQGIYSWRGAENALDALGGERLYLTQSFRFGQAVADVARRVLQSKPLHQPDRPLRGSRRASRVLLGHSASVVLCRTNAGVLRAAVFAAKDGASVHVVGGIAELAEELESAVALYEGRLHDVQAESLKRFADWQELREEADQLQDAVLGRLVEAVEGTDVLRDLAVLKRQHVGSEDQAEVVVSTCHKAKGREWPMVCLARDFLTLEKMAKRYWSVLGRSCEGGRVSRERADAVMQVLEEWHVLYVAVTRAVETLVLPESLYEELAA
jgi:superfamily I DNA/RNA helicase